MEWEFTPEQVVKGEAAYGLTEFRMHLADELSLNLQEASEAEFAQCYDALYDLCYWLATGKPIEDFLTGFNDDPATLRFVLAAKDHMDANVTMLGAILQRLIVERVEGGLPLERAISEVHAHHARVTARAIETVPDAPVQ